MNESELVSRALAMRDHYRDPLQGAFALAWRAMRLLERTRELAREHGVTFLVRGRGIPASAEENFACALVESTGKMPIKGGMEVNHELSSAARLAWRIARRIRARQIAGSLFVDNPASAEDGSLSG